MAAGAGEHGMAALVEEREARLERFFRGLAEANSSALLLDYDGTLAPFRVDASRARPSAGIVPLLDGIGDCERARIVFVTGRPAQDVPPLLGLARSPEVWGLHGAEHLLPDGRVERVPLSPDAQDAIEKARAEVVVANLGFRVEHKPNSVAVHWRGKSFQAAAKAREQALGLMHRYLDVPTVKLLEFDGGLELRAGSDKGDAVRAIRGELAADAVVAYLGDDTTDEDAFAALGDEGLSVLVRREWRPTAAQAWMRPPAELRQFLRRWKKAVYARASIGT